jgi:hypothetical protein
VDKREDDPRYRERQTAGKRERGRPKIQRDRELLPCDVYCCRYENKRKDIVKWITFL